MLTETILRKTSGWLPTFLTVIVWGALAVPTVWFPKARVVLESAMPGASAGLIFATKAS
jgi:hypothetical protein